MTWRTGTKLGRTLYIDNQFVGVVDTENYARRIVAAMNQGPPPHLAEVCEANRARNEMAAQLERAKELLAACRGGAEIIRSERNEALVTLQALRESLAVPHTEACPWRLTAERAEEDARTRQAMYREIEGRLTRDLDEARALCRGAQAAADHAEREAEKAKEQARRPRHEDLCELSELREKRRAMYRESEALKEQLASAQAAITAATTDLRRERGWRTDLESLRDRVHDDLKRLADETDGIPF